MTIYDVPNIEHCTVTERLGGKSYKVVANSGWFIHYNDGDEETENFWFTVILVRSDYDFSLIQIVAEADLPEGAEICAVV